MHVCTGLVFVRFWRFFDDSPSAKYVCAAVPALATLHFVAVGLGYVNDAALVAGATRTGNRRELLRGPLLKLPWNPDKSWAGSAACAIGGFLAAHHVVQGFRKIGYLTLGAQPPNSVWIATTAACALVGAAVESLPVADYDNLTMSVAVWLTSLWLFGF
ncbi:hypothetical protein WJX72_004953 [[Myrmecia] bisecta]|uniref:Uncharacterized protein n=1 Tax=[Myrmecia] bisecta TaxID=41462 RepID=A0AAW1PQD1_9CHLO